MKTKTSFKPGEGGRKPGVPNKLPKTVKEGFLNAFIELQNDPKNNILEFARKNPKLFYALATKLIPTELKGAFNGKTILEIVRKSNTPTGPE